MDFDRWLDRTLRKFASPTIPAYAFNLYEHEDAFTVQVIGAARLRADALDGVVWV